MRLIPLFFCFMCIFCSVMPTFAAESWSSGPDKVFVDGYDDISEIIAQDLDLHGQLIKAVFEGNDALVTELKKQGADINAQDDYNGDTALIRNVSIESPIDFIEKLLKAGARVGIKNKYNKTVLDYFEGECYACCNYSIVPESSSAAIALIAIELKTLLRSALQQEIADVKETYKKVRIKAICCLLFCSKKSDNLFFKKLPTAIMQEIHNQLKAINEAEILKQFS